MYKSEWKKRKLSEEREEIKFLALAVLTIGVIMVLMIPQVLELIIK